MHKMRLQPGSSVPSKFPVPPAKWRAALSGLLCVLALAVAGCGRAPEQAPRVPARADGPDRALQQLMADIRRNDLNAYARDAVPPALPVELDPAGRQGRTTRPLVALPLGPRLPGFVSLFAAPDGEARLERVFQRQFAGAPADVHSAAATLGLFGAQYLRTGGDYSADERAHYLQLVHALSLWGQRAPLSDRQKAKPAIEQLTSAARHTGLREPAAFARVGRRGALRRLGPFFGRFKRVLAGYGLDIDAALAGAKVRVLSRQGDHARLALDYTMAGTPIHAELDAERVDGRWYLSDALRRARAEAARR